MKKIIAILITFISISFHISAFVITSEKFGYTLDLPEGFEITDMEKDESMAVFGHKYLQIESVIKVSDPQKSTKETLSENMAKLKAKSEFSECMWRRQKCAVSSFSSSLLITDETGQSVEANGWAVCVPLPQKKGNITMLTYAPNNVYENLMQVIISSLDSLMIDSGSLKEPGIITTAFFPREKQKEIELQINGHKIKTQIDEIDAEANQFVIDREFGVFKFYAQNNLPEMFDAWTRFYRLIAKDSIYRLKKVSFDIYSELKDEAAEKDPKNSNAAIAQTLLNWTQNFEYARKSSNPNKADIESIPAILEGKFSDCDGRSILLMCIYKNMGIDSCMFLSAAYRHAMVGVYFPDKKGQTIMVADENGGKNYLVGETTAKNLTFGLMDASMGDKSKWICVECYN